jgi:hypothetical protein
LRAKPQTITLRLWFDLTLTSSIEMCNKFICSCAPCTVSPHSVLHNGWQVPSYKVATLLYLFGYLQFLSRLLLSLQLSGHRWRSTTLPNPNEQNICIVAILLISSCDHSCPFFSGFSKSVTICLKIITWSSNNVCLAELRRAVPTWVWNTVANSQTFTDFLDLMYVLTRSKGECNSVGLYAAINCGLFLNWFIQTEKKLLWN